MGEDTGDGHKIFWTGPGCCTCELVAVVTALTGPSQTLAGWGPCIAGGGFGRWLDSCWPLATGRRVVVVSGRATTLGVPWFPEGRKREERRGRPGTWGMGRRWWSAGRERGSVCDQGVACEILKEFIKMRTRTQTNELRVCAQSGERLCWRRFLLSQA